MSNIHQLIWWIDRKSSPTNDEKPEFSCEKCGERNVKKSEMQVDHYDKVRFICVKCQSDTKG